MTLEPMLRLIAGFFVAASVLLGIYVHPYFLWFTLFVGLNLAQSAFHRGGTDPAAAAGHRSAGRLRRAEHPGSRRIRSWIDDRRRHARPSSSAAASSAWRWSRTSSIAASR